MNKIKQLLLTTGILILTKSCLYADVPIPCFIIENHIHTIDKNNNLIICSCTLQNASSYTNHNRMAIEEARKHHKKFDPGPPSIKRGNGFKPYFDTVCYYQQMSFKYRGRSCYDKEVKAKVVNKDTVIDKPTRAKKMVIPTISFPDGNTPLFQLYMSSIYLIPLLLTLLIETLLAIGFMLSFKIPLRLLWVVPLCSIITHPILAYLQWHYFLSFNQVILVECAIILVEMLIILTALQHRIKPSYAFTLSAVMNAGSFLIGLSIL